MVGTDPRQRPTTPYSPTAARSRADVVGCCRAAAEEEEEGDEEGDEEEEVVEEEVEGDAGEEADGGWRPSTLCICTFSRSSGLAMALPTDPVMAPAATLRLKGVCSGSVAPRACFTGSYIPMRIPLYEPSRTNEARRPR